MAGNLLGNNGVSGFTAFAQQTAVTYSSAHTAVMYLCRFKLSQADLVGSQTIMFTGNSFGCTLNVNAATNEVTSSIRTQSPARNVADVVIGTVVPDQVYTVVSRLVSGTLQHFLDGVQVGSDIITGGTQLSFTLPTTLQGTNILGENRGIVEAAVWVNSAASVANIGAYPTLGLGSFATPPTHRYAPVGSGEIVTVFTDLSGTNDMTQTTGPTAVTVDSAQAPTVDGGSGYVGTVSITNINGKATTAASNLFIGRDRSTGQRVSIVSGTYTGDLPTGINIKTGTGVFKAVQDATIAGGIWSGTLTIDQGIGLTTSPENDPLVTQVMSGFYCGDWLIPCGQSNGEGKAGSGSSASLPVAYPPGGTVLRANTGTGAITVSAPSVDYYAGSAAALISRSSGVPVCLANVAIGATAISTWQEGNTSWVTADAELVVVGAKNDASAPLMLWWQGESDEGSTPGATYKTLLNAFIASAKAVWNIGKVYIIPIKSRELTNSQGIIDAQLEVAAQNANAYFGAMTSDIVYSAYSAPSEDTLHVTEPQEHLIIGSRLSSSITTDLFGGEAPGYGSGSSGGGGVLQTSMVRDILS